MSIDKHPIYSIGTSANLIWGCDRDFFFIASLSYFLIVYVSMTILSAIVSLSLFLITLKVLRQLAKADPYMSKILIKHIKYKKFYFAHSTPFCSNSKAYH